MSNQFFDRIREDISHELDSIVPSLSNVWKEVSVVPQKPSRQQELNEWMNMPTEARQQLAMELGPDGYTNLVNEKAQLVSDFFGPDIAQTLMPYFMQDVQVAQQVSQQEVAYQASLTGQPPVDDLQPIDLESEIDRYLVDSIEQETN